MYLFIYIVVSLLAVILGLRVYLLTRNISGVFFFGFTLFLSTWFILYFLFFVDFITSPVVLLYLSRINFIIGLIAVYNLLFFITYFNSKNTNTKPLKYVLLPGVIGLAIMYIFSGYIIDTLRFSADDGVYREVYGSLYFITIILYLLFLVLFIIVGFFKLKRQTSLDKLRMRRILNAAYFMLFMMILLQVFLPLYDIWILEKELIFFYLYFVIQTYATLRRYYFGSIGYGIGKVIVFGLSLFLAIEVYLWSYVMMKEELNTGRFWNFDDPFSIVNLVIAIIIFHFSYKIISHWLLGNGRNESLKESIFSLQKEIVPTIEYSETNKILSHSMKSIFGIEKSKIIIFQKELEGSYENTRKYFEFGFSDNIYIHDIVFQEERKALFDVTSMVRELPQNTFIIFPLLSEEECVGIFVLCAKSFGDFFMEEEIKVLRNLSYFLSSHVRYIKTYNELQDLSLNLDKKVDEKTIAYNDLINKQKEFISVISHEIKSPIASAIFQADSIIDDIKQKTITLPKIKDELNILNDQLLRTSGIITKLFSVQYYDAHTVHLFLEKIQFAYFLEHELALFAHVHPEITLISNIAPDIGFVSLDKIQFQQVLSNLLDNALKFIQSEDDMVIVVNVKQSDGTLKVIIEDNGNGFEGIEPKDVFDKYKTGRKGMIGLGMGLYLCKAIISMHRGTIEADNSEEYGGARFTITLPIK